MRQVKQRDWFEFVIRVLGLISLLAGLLYVYSTIVAYFAPDGPNTYPAWQYGLAAVFYVICALYFLRGAPHIVRFAFQEKRE